MKSSSLSLTSCDHSAALLHDLGMAFCAVSGFLFGSLGLVVLAKDGQVSNELAGER